MFRRKVPCKACQKSIAENIAGQNQGFCHQCFEKHLREERTAARAKGEEALPVFFTKDCKIGICDRLKQHHANLADDPERLSTDFLVGLICGADGQEDYRELKKERKGTFLSRDRQGA